jgi:copper chaperone CopZ
MIKRRLLITGMHCTSCSLLIEGELMDMGVDATCDFAKGYVDVSYDEKKIQEERIIKAIETLGYVVSNPSR